MTAAARAKKLEEEFADMGIRARITVTEKGVKVQAVNEADRLLTRSILTKRNVKLVE